MIVVNEEDLRTFAYHVYVDTTYKFVFFTYPKVASSEWIRLFMRLQGVEDWRDNPHYRVTDHLRPLFPRLRTIDKVGFLFSPQQANTMNETPAHHLRRHSRSDWERLMEQYESGDIPQRQFCEVHGLAYSTFGYWRKQLRSTRRTARTVRQVEPVLELPVYSSHGSPWRVELDLGQGMILRIG
jgi:hypothetical protein